MSQRFPIFINQPGATLYSFKITGASVGVTPGTAGLDGRGKFLASISKAGNVVTISWTEKFADAPYVFFSTANGVLDKAVDIVTNTKSTLVYQTVVRSTNVAASDVDLYVYVVGYSTTSFMS